MIDNGNITQQWLTDWLIYVDVQKHTSARIIINIHVQHK